MDEEAPTFAAVAVAGGPLTTVESLEEHLAVTAHRLLSRLSLITAKAEFLRAHRHELDEDLCELWLSDIETDSKELSRYLSLIARGIKPDLPPT